MEKMPYQPELERARDHRRPPTTQVTDQRLALGTSGAVGTAEFTLRELRIEDAPSLLRDADHRRSGALHLAAAEHGRGFRAVHRLDASRARWRAITSASASCPQGIDHGVGIFQLRSDRSPALLIGEWGFALGSPFWGTGLFAEGARLVLNFAVDIVGVQRLEARAAVANGRGNGALRKIGAVQEGVLRRSFLRNGAVSRSGAVVDPRRGLAPAAKAIIRPPAALVGVSLQPSRYALRRQVGLHWDRASPSRRSLRLLGSTLQYLKVSDFDFDLPADLIAQEPPAERGTSRLLALDRSSGRISHHQFSDLPSLLTPGDVIVVNDTRVFPARLIGKRLPGGGAAECFLVKAGGTP